MPKPILRIPMLAIHLQRDINSTGFNPNKQTECTPLLALQVSRDLCDEQEGASSRLWWRRVAGATA